MSSALKHRICIDLTEGAYRRILEIRMRGGYRSNAAAVKNGLRFLEWFLKLKDEGARLAIIKDDSFAEVDIDFSE